MSSLLPQLVHAGARISKAIHAGSFKCANAVHAKKASTSLQLPFRTLFTSSKTHRAQAHPQPRAARAFVPQIPPSSHSSVRFAGGNIWREIHSQSNAKSEANLITARRLAAPIGLVGDLVTILKGVLKHFKRGWIECMHHDAGDFIILYLILFIVYSNHIELSGQ